MANKHVKRCSTPDVIRETQMKTRQHLTPMRLAGVQDAESTRPHGEVEQQGLLPTAGGNAKCHSPLKQLEGFLQNYTYSSHTVQQPLAFTQKRESLPLDVYSSFTHNCSRTRGLLSRMQKEFIQNIKRPYNFLMDKTLKYFLKIPK